MGKNVGHKYIDTKKGVIFSSNFIQNNQVITRLFPSSPLFLRKEEINTRKSIGHFTQRPNKLLFFSGKMKSSCYLKVKLYRAVSVAEEV